MLASSLPTGSVSWLYYSDRLVELPLGVFGIAIATVLLPNLSTIRFSRSDSQANEESPAAASEDSEAFSPEQSRQFLSALDWSLRCIFLLAMPACVALLLIAEPILYLLFQYDAMQASDVQMAALSMRAYALGLLWFMAIKVLATGYYAQQDTRTPVRIGIIAMVANMIFNLIFVWIAHRFWGVGHVGLALATSLSALINAVLLYRGLASSKELVRHSSRGRSLLQQGTPRIALLIAIATLLMAIVLALFQPDSGWWPGSVFSQRLWEVSKLVVMGVVVYFTALFLMGLRLADFRYQPAKLALAAEE